MLNGPLGLTWDHYMRPTIVKGTYVTIMMGNGASPEVFSPICGLTAKGLTAQTNTTDDFVRDCADPEDIPSRYVTATGQQWDLSGSGLLNLDNLEDILDAQGVVRNYRYVIGAPTGSTSYNGYFAGAGMMTNLQFGGPEEGKASVDITIASDGPWEWTEA